MTLKPHPMTPGGPVSAIRAYVERWSAERLWVRFHVEGDVGRVVWPDPSSGGRADGLWQTTCFEAFLSSGDRYWEFNFSPSGQWAAYRFEGYRAGQADAVETAAPHPVEIGHAGAEMEALFERPEGAVRMAISAVIETTDGEKSYWALSHPSDKPDFHHPDSFVLELP